LLTDSFSYNLIEFGRFYDFTNKTFYVIVLRGV